MESDDIKLSALPKPQPGKESRRRPMAVAAAALMLLDGLTFWLTRDDETKRDIVTKAESTLQSAGLDPLLSAAKELITPPPPPPPVHSVGVAEPGLPASGTLIQGSMPALVPEPPPAEVSTQNEEATTAVVDATPAASPGVMPQQREDTVILPDFVHDLANWLVARYRPAPQGGKGQINASIQAANMRYGMHMRGMERQGRDPAGARAHILRYAFNPTMLEALYGIYADRLVDEVARAALAPSQGKALSEAQLDDLYKNYAAFFADLASVTSGIAAMHDLKERIETLNRDNQRIIALHRQITENVFALDEAREKRDEAAIPAIEARIEALDRRYRTSLQAQSNARGTLVSAIRSSGPGQARRLDDDSVFFLALWVERRMDKQADALDAVRKASALLTDLSQRFQNAGSTP